MDDITIQFEEALRRHLRSAKPDAINYDAELVQLGLDSMTAVAVLLDMEKTFNIRFPDEMLVEAYLPDRWKAERSGPAAPRAPGGMTRPLPDRSLGLEWTILELLARGIVARELAMESGARECSDEFVRQTRSCLGHRRAVSRACRVPKRDPRLRWHIEKASRAMTKPGGTR